MLPPKVLLLSCLLFPGFDDQGAKLPFKDALHRIGTTRFRQGDGILSLAYSPSGKMLACGGRNDPIHLIDADTGQLLRQLNEHWIWAMAFSPDGKYLATGGANKVVRLWDVESGKEVVKLSGHKATIKALAFSSDGLALVSAGDDGAVRLWKVPSGGEVATYREHNLTVNAVTISPDSRHFASAGTDRTIRVWEWAQKTVVINTPAVVTGIAYLPSRKALITTDEGGFVRVWDIASARQVREWKGHDGIISRMVLSQDAAVLTTSSPDGTVRTWDVAKGTAFAKIPGRTGDSDALAMTVDGKVVAAGGVNSAIRRWDAMTGKPLADPALPDGPVTAIVCSPDGSIAAAGLTTNQVLLLDPATGKEKGRLDCGSQDADVRLAFSSDGKLLATAGSPDAVILWNVAESTPSKRFTLPQKDDVRCLAFSPDSLKIAVGCASAGMIILDANSGKTHKQLPVPHGVRATAFTPDGKLLAVATEDDIVIYETDAYQPVRKFAKLNDTVACLAFSPDGRTLAVGMFASVVRLFDLTVPKENPEHRARTLDGHQGVVNAVAWSINGRCLVTAGFDKTVRVWEFNNGQPIFTWTGHDGEASAVAFHPLGRMVVSGSRDTTLLVWDATGLGLAGKVAETKQLDVPAFDALWKELASDNNPGGNKAMWAMVSARDNVKYLAKKVFLTDPKKIKKYFEDLDSNNFKIREAAFSALASYGRWIEKQVRQELEKPCSEEVRQRLAILLKRFAVDDAVTVEQESLRVRRVVEILEQTNTPAAFDLLQSMAAGAQEAELRDMAHAAHERLTKRKSG
jgi:WD40 repeat protein